MEIDHFVLTRRLLFAAATALAVASGGNAATTSGVLSADEVWSGTVTLTGDVTVPAGVTLTVQPGTKVRFPAGADSTTAGTDPARTELLVRGSLRAMGEAASPIVFTSASAVPAKGDWGGIRVSWTMGTTALQLDWCVVEYATAGVRVEAATGLRTAMITRSSIRNNGGDGIYAHAASTAKLSVTLDGNQLTGNDGYGVYTHAEHEGSKLSGSLAGNTVAQNGNHGIYIYSYNYATSELDVRNNVVHDHPTKYGIYLHTQYTYSGTSRLTVTDNTVYGASYGIYAYTYYSGLRLDIGRNEVYQATHGIYANAQAYLQDTVLETTLRDNDVHDNTSTGLFVTSNAGSLAGPTVTVRGNRVRSNSGYGIRVNAQGSNPATPPSVTLNEIFGNGSYGIFASSTGPLLFLHNDIRDNGSIGLYLASGEGSRVHFNRFAGNGNRALYNSNGANVNAQFNDWGAVTTAEMATGGNPKNIAAIWDVFDSVSSGRVDYSQWLGASPNSPVSPTSRITSPPDGSVLNTASVRLQGTAVAPAGVARVEVSTDGGTTWTPADGTNVWSLDWAVAGDGQYTIQSRAIDASGTVEVPEAGAAIAIVLDSTLTNVTSGPLTADRTWSGEITLTGDVIVPSGVTLTIEPGTTVRFAPFTDDQGAGSSVFQSELIVQGSLIAVGTEAAPIVFTPTAANPVVGDWHWIHVLTTASSESVTLEHCVLEYADTGIYVEADVYSLALRISRCRVRQMSDDGIVVLVRNGAHVTAEVVDNEVTSVGGYGVYFQGKDTGTQMSGTVARNTVHGCYRDGIYVRYESTGVGGSALAVADNTVYQSATGIYAYATNSELYLDIAGNDLSGNTTGMNAQVSAHDGQPVLTFVAQNNDVHDNSSTGINLSASGPRLSASIRGNQVRGNHGAGLTLSGSQSRPLIALNQVHNNLQRGIVLSSSSVPVVLYNHVFDNGRDAVYASVGDGTQIRFNNLVGSVTFYGLNNYGTKGVDARNNYWGTTVTQEMEDGGNPKNINGIFDIYDDASKGRVEYQPWLPGPVALPSGPLSRITSPEDGAALKAEVLRLQGIAVAPAGVERVEVSIDGGLTWQAAQGRETWFIDWLSPPDGTYAALSRAVDEVGTVELPGSAVTVTVNSALPTTAGVLAADETWSGMVALRGDITVPEGVTLTVERVLPVSVYELT